MEEQTPTSAEWQSAVIRALSQPNGFPIATLSSGGLYREILAHMPANTREKPQLIHEVIWSLIRQGLVFLDFYADGTGQNRFDAWLRLTRAGQAAADEDYQGPDTPDHFFERVKAKAPGASELVLQYVQEAITTYRNCCDLASAVMTGVASEAAFLEMARAFDQWLGDTPNAPGGKFRSTIRNGHLQIKSVFDDFCTAFEANKREIPYRLRDGIESEVFGVFTVLRIFRNDAGHPTAISIDRETVSNHLRFLPRYLERLYSLKEHFEQKTPADQPHS